MAVAFDNTIATVLFNRRAQIPADPATGKPIEAARERIQGLVDDLQREKARIVVPTPVIAELLTVSGPEGTQYFDTLTKSKVFEIGDFDARAALEVSLMNNEALAEGDKKAGIDAPWQKIKVDRQIIAICRVRGVDVLYTDDASLAETALRAGVKTRGIHDLPIPEAARQMGFGFEPREDIRDVSEIGRTESAERE